MDISNRTANCVYANTLNSLFNILNLISIVVEGAITFLRRRALPEGGNISPPPSAAGEGARRDIGAAVEGGRAGGAINSRDGGAEEGAGRGRQSRDLAERLRAEAKEATERCDVRDMASWCMMSVRFYVCIVHTGKNNVSKLWFNPPVCMAMRAVSMSISTQLLNDSVENYALV